MSIFKRLQRHLDRRMQRHLKAALAAPAPLPYEPRTVVPGDALPRRFNREDRALDQAARRGLLAAIYFDEDFAADARAEVTTPKGGTR